MREQTKMSVIDNVLSTQPELGPKIPDGGYGWFVFVGTLFFQIFIPSLIVVYGVLLMSVKLNRSIEDEEILHLWDDHFIHVPLSFIISWILFDPTARNLISRGSYPRVISQIGNCLTCAGLLFIWMGIAGNRQSPTKEKMWFLLAGIFSGIGSSIQVAQCEIIMAQYFKLKHLYLTHIAYIFIGFGFVVSPVLIAYLRMKYNLLQVVFIYQAIFFQGFMLNILFKKPNYLQSKLVRYHYVMENEDEEDIFSKSLNELKVKTKDVLERIEIKNDIIVHPSSSRMHVSEEEKQSEKHRTNNWIQFEKDENSVSPDSWERFEDESVENIEGTKDEHMKTHNQNPSPLFNNNAVNMNTTYSFDDFDIEFDEEPRSVPTVFAESEKRSTFNLAVYLKILQLPTFYKSLLTVITTKYSVFVYYVFFPSYLYVQISHLNYKRTAFLVGCSSIVMLLFSGFSYWLNVNKQKRPIILFLLCWIGANGYFLIATYRHNEYIVLFGAFEIVLSIASLQHIGGPLLGINIRGESNSEYTALCILTGISFLFFVVQDISYQNCFLLMSLMHVITGLVWVANFFYKKLTLLH